MNNLVNIKDETIRRFWDNYIALLFKIKVKESTHIHYVRQAERYIKNYPEDRLSTHSRSHIDQYLQEVGQNTYIKDGQFFQAVHAIRNIFTLTQFDVKDKVDWDYWINSAQKFSANHPTLASEQVTLPDESSTQPDSSTDTVKTIKLKHEALLTDFLTEVRRHHMHENTLQKSVKRASDSAGIIKKVNCSSLRHSFATHVLNRGGKAVISPLDQL